MIVARVLSMRLGLLYYVSGVISAVRGDCCCCLMSAVCYE